ncbi:MAG TPA: hypothetical protein VHC49_26680 [Mycobacteriales bacterium]|nr:hypothetical protein [Mycobacteriales bacterium]
MDRSTLPLLAVVGFKAGRFAPFGGVRILAFRDGVFRVLGRKNRIDIDTPINQLTVRLTRTRTVELSSPGGSGFAYGVPDDTKLRGELVDIARAELDRMGEDGELLGPIPTGWAGPASLRALRGQIQVSKELTEALHARGAG